MQATRERQAVVGRNPVVSPRREGGHQATGYLEGIVYTCPVGRI